MTLAAWQADVVEDLTPFCDLATAPEVTPFGTHMDVRIRRNDRDYQLEVRNTDSGITAQPAGGTAVSFSSLLASPDFGDLSRLASQVGILSNFRRSQSRQEIRGRAVYTYDWYVDPVVTADRTGWQVRTARADDVLAAVLDDGACAPESTDATDLVFLTAQAGQGKSSTLRRFHLRQAERYRRGEAQRLTFYVDAQGRGLTNLADVLAREINELRMNLPHPAILSLVRRGLVTLIVDGFDELVGARGTYEGAFSSLTTFLERLGGKGQVIAAARSAFFTEEYLARPQVLSGESGSHRITRLELVPWSNDDRTAFLARAKQNTHPGLISNSVEENFTAIQQTAHGDLLTRPLFSRDVLVATIEGGRAVQADSDLSLVSTIASNYLEREVAEKLLAPGRISILSASQLNVFFDDLAAEMWALETRELDLGTTRTLMELRCEEWGADPSSVRLLLDRVGTLPFLLAGPVGQHTILFEHELFFSFFLSSTLASQVFGEGSGAQSALSRARLAHDDAQLLAERYFLAGGNAQAGLDALSRLAGKRHPRQGQIQVNCGSIAAGMLRHLGKFGSQSGLRIEGLVFDGDSLQGVRATAARLVGCTFNRVDLRDARISGQAEGTEFYAAVVDEFSTAVNLVGLDPDLPIVQIEQFTDGRIAPVYEHSERDRLLRAVGFLPEEAGTPRLSIPDETLFVVTQLCRAFDEMNPVGERHDKYRSAFDSYAWPQVRDALVDNELMKVVTKSVKGPRQTFFRKKFSTSELLAALYAPSPNASVERFWQGLGQ